MEGIDLIPVSEEKKNRLVIFAQHYAKFANIHIKVLEADESSATVRVTQHYNKQGKYQDQKGLIERTKDTFKGEVPDGYDIHVRAIPYTPHATDQVDLDWIRSKMEEYGLSQVDLVRALGVDKPTISKIMAGRHELTKLHRAAFYYLFKTLKKSHIYPISSQIL